MARSPSVVFLWALAALAVVQGESPVLSHLDKIDVDEVLADQARVKAAVHCFLSDQDDACNVRAKVIKSLISELVHTDCAECSDGQKAGVVKFMRYVSENMPAEMKQLLQKYDPEGKALDQFRESWRQNGIKV